MHRMLEKGLARLLRSGAAHYLACMNVNTIQLFSVSLLE